MLSNGTHVAKICISICNGHRNYNVWRWDLLKVEKPIYVRDWEVYEPIVYDCVSATFLLQPLDRAWYKPLRVGKREVGRVIDWQCNHDWGPPQILVTEIVRSSGRFSSTYTLIYGLDRRNERAKLVHTSKWSYIRDITLYTYQPTVFNLWKICNVFVFRFIFWCQDMSIIQLEGTKLVLLNTMLCAYGQKVLFTTVRTK